MKQRWNTRCHCTIKWLVWLTVPGWPDRRTTLNLSTQRVWTAPCIYMGFKWLQTGQSGRKMYSIECGLVWYCASCQRICRGSFLSLESSSSKKPFWMVNIYTTVTLRNSVMWWIAGGEKYQTYFGKIGLLPQLCWESGANLKISHKKVEMFQTFPEQGQRDWCRFLRALSSFTHLSLCLSHLHCFDLPETQSLTFLKHKFFFAHIG